MLSLQQPFPEDLKDEEKWIHNCLTRVNSILSILYYLHSISSGVSACLLSWCHTCLKLWSYHFPADGFPLAGDWGAKMTTKENREEFSGSAKESQACFFLWVGGWVNATGGKTTVMRQEKQQTKYKGYKLKACLYKICSLTQSKLNIHTRACMWVHK